MDNYGIAPFITIEGIDGAGKTEQIDLIREYLKSKNISLETMREPGGTPLSEKIRNLILTNKDIDKSCEMLLFAASRAEVTNKNIIPLLTSGTIVISDRYMDSSYAYQGCLGVSDDTINTINEFSGVIPNATIVLDISAEESLRRTRLRSNGEDLDAIESRGLEYFKGVRNRFLNLPKMNGRKVFIIDSENNDIDTVFKKVKEIIDDLIFIEK